VELLDQPVRQELLDHQVLAAQVELLDQPVRQELLDHQVLPGQVELRVLLEQAVLVELQVLQVLVVRTRYPVVLIYSLTIQLIVIFLVIKS
jgi:uncharacterized membrane protein